MPLLLLTNVAHEYARRCVLESLSFGVERGGIACLLGPSGCGKTTVLRCIAGFERIVAGEIYLNDLVVSSGGTHLPPEGRHCGMVFQDYALFPHLTVAGNVAFGLRGRDATGRRVRVAEVLAAVGLAGIEEAWPHELSGGQQQRVALARALAPQPQLLLLDEPFSNLDAELRERLALEVRGILKASNTTAILVTHDQREAFAVADEIGIMQAGRIEQWDTPYNLYHWPANRFVADFVGEGVLLPGRVLGPRQVAIELGILDGNVPEKCIAGCPSGCDVDVLLRPDDVVCDETADMRALVAGKAFRGAEFLYTLQLPSGARVLSLVPSHHDYALGEWIGIRVDANHVVAFHEEAGASHR
ncbi:ABC transporter ATP-binding protein [Aromatoleum toluclasticum]|uniref:ABC transporter ATP-binding protein n=1 Tax=Aromatoleum toluclasticum TaxID=92003 RepID=UPI000475D1CA|nr:ABC transporter ATP-binding protein [Aromatoleum toluclasticum]